MSFFVPSFLLEFNLKCSFEPIFQDYHFETSHKVEAFGIEKTNKLSFKCWEESGHEPGLAIGHRADINTNRKLFRYTTCINMSGNLQYAKNFIQNSRLITHEEFAMQVVKNNETVGHLPREHSYFIARCGKIRLAETGCRRLVVRVKRKLMA